MVDKMKAYVMSGNIYIKVYMFNNLHGLYARFTDDDPYLVLHHNSENIQYNPSIKLQHNLISLIFRRLQEKIKEIN